MIWSEPTHSEKPSKDTSTEQTGHPSDYLEQSKEEATRAKVDTLESDSVAPGGQSQKLIKKLPTISKNEKKPTANNNSLLRAEFHAYAHASNRNHFSPF